MRGITLNGLLLAVALAVSAPLIGPSLTRAQAPDAESAVRVDGTAQTEERGGADFRAASMSLSAASWSTGALSPGSIPVLRQLQSAIRQHPPSHLVVATLACLAVLGLLVRRGRRPVSRLG